jgi:hypothetical protein
VRLLLAAQIARHAVVLVNIAASLRFLDHRGERADLPGDDVRIAVVLPLLREQSMIGSAVAHFRSMLREQDLLMLVTTARETAIASLSASTPALATALADDTQVRHLHLADPAGRKGDQVNLGATALCDGEAGAPDGRWLVVVYDADSRPPHESLPTFAAAAAAHPDVSVFHQSARFEVRDVDLSMWENALAQGGALRANRFVLAYELPRLRSRSPGAGVLRRWIAGMTYGHVSGHGLGVRLGFLIERPMPSRTVMEDMHYSFQLATDRIPVVPLASLDRSEVPVPWREQFRQAERWFAGPGRAVAYARERRAGGRRGGGAVTASALLISCEWLSCAPALAMLIDGLRRRGIDGALSAAFLGLYGSELILSTRAAQGPRSSKIAGLLAFGPVNIGFGLAGWAGLLGGIVGRQAREKTER